MVSREVDRRRLVNMSDAVNGQFPSDAGPADKRNQHRNPVLVSVGRAKLSHAPVPRPVKGECAVTTTAKLAAMLLKETSPDSYTPRSAAAEILLLIITGPEGKRSAGFSARVLELMGYIAQEMNERENVHRALRPEFARIVEASDI